MLMPKVRRRKRGSIAFGFSARDGTLRPGLNAHHRIHPSYVITCVIPPSFQVENGNERVGLAPNSTDLIFQDSYVAVFSGGRGVVVVHTRVSGGRIRVDVHVGTLRVQPGRRVWSLSCSPCVDTLLIKSLFRCCAGADSLGRVGLGASECAQGSY